MTYRPEVFGRTIQVYRVDGARCLITDAALPEATEQSGTPGSPR
jgi:hypothetical protein